LGKFEDLKAWQRAKDLSIFVYKLTSSGEFERDFGLRDQMRRSSVSIPSNIAEGDENGTDKQAIRFFYVAKGSAAELLTQAIIAEAVNYINQSDYQHISEECKGISGMLAKLIRSRSTST